MSRLQYSAGLAGVSADDTFGLGVVLEPGRIVEARVAYGIANIGDSTVTVDIQKNGTSILSTLMSFSSTDAAHASKTGVMKTDTTVDVIAGDNLQFIVNATVGTGTLAFDLSVTVEQIYDS